MAESKKVLITGGNKGIGLATTEKFITAGAHVYVVARDFKNFSLSTHPNVTQITYDLANINDIATLVAKLPAIDVLINNAGIMHALPYNDYPQAKIEQMLKINLEAPVALITEISKKMIKNGRGRIVNNASIAGQIGHPDIWYGITKAGMINATKSFAKILGPQGILVNAVAPGPVETEMLATIPQSRKTATKNTIFTGRFAYAEEIAKTIFWLASESPEYINGTCIDINDGALLR